MHDAPSPLDFFSGLQWIDGARLLQTMEPYRQRLMMDALFTFRDDGQPLYNMVLSGRGKKNWKSTDMLIAAFYRLLIWESPQGNDCLILANDEDQAGDDLALAKKLVAANPILADELIVMQKEIVRRDGMGAMKILPARNVIGAHGKTAIFIGFDEIHGYKDWGLFEALAPDPTRPDALTWIASYDTIFNRPGVPLHDLKQIGKEGSDPRMLFSWYSGDLCTDPDFAEKSPEVRANPSMGSWPEGMAYLEQQKRRLPSHKYRRLHLNLPGAPDGAFLDADVVTFAINKGRRSTPPQPGISYHGFVDMSGGSQDDACLSIAHKEAGRVVVDVVMSQRDKPPFNPRDAVKRFAATLKEYNLKKVTGDAYAGETFRQDFNDEGIRYVLSPLSKSDLYDEFEPKLNAGEVDLPDIPKLETQLLTLVLRGAKIDHATGEHDDYANAAAGTVWLVSSSASNFTEAFMRAMGAPRDDGNDSRAFHGARLRAHILNH